MKKKFALLRLIFALIRIARNPERTDSVFEIGESLYIMGATEASRTKFQTDPESLAIIQNRKLLMPYDLQELQKLPAGTLGRVYADHMIGKGLDPDFYKSIDIKDDTAFVIMRIRQTHDLWHVMTGFDTSVPGELGLQSFMVAQISVPVGLILISGGLFQIAIKRQELLEPVMENIVKGWQLGKKAKILFGIDWEKNWTTPLQDLQRAYRLMD